MLALLLLLTIPPRVATWSARARGLLAALVVWSGPARAATVLPLVPPPPDLIGLVPFAEAPVIGHGTGATRGLFERVATHGEYKASSEVIGIPRSRLPS